MPSPWIIEPARIGGLSKAFGPPIISPAASDFTVDTTSLQQVIDGFGAASKFLPSWTTTATADLLWSTTNGIGLSLVRDGISCHGYPLVFPFSGADEADDTTFATLSQIVAYGVKPWATIWFFPKGTDEAGNGSGLTDWTDGSGALATGHYSDAATLLTTYLDRAVAKGIYHLGLSFMNEPDIHANGETLWSTTQALNFVKNNLAYALALWGATNPTWRAATGLSQPWIMVGEPSQWSQLSTWTSAFEGDSAALASVGYYGVHQYNGGGASAPGTVSKPIWQTECSTQAPAFTGFTQSLSEGVAVAQMIHDALTTGNARAWHFWWAEMVGSGDNEALIGDGNGTFNSTNWNAPAMTKRLYALGNWSRFVRPGWQRVSVSGSKAGIYGVTAFKSGSQTAVVIINNSGSPVSLTIGYKAPAIPAVAPWITSGTTLGSLFSDGNLSNGSASASLSSSLSLSSNQLSITVPAGVTTLVN